MTYNIRKFSIQDRADVRRLCCETAFLESDRGLIFKDDELLADFLSLYFTDFEPHSCFVATDGSKVVGYLIGSIHIPRMKRIIKRRILPSLLVKVFYRKAFLNKTNLNFFFRCVLSFFKGEFFVPDYSKEFPATLHINIDKSCRGQDIGGRLIEVYINFLKQQQIKGVQLSTFSEKAKNFFLKMGFDILYARKRSYLKSVIAGEVTSYVFGKKL
jgi:GNAT superfamily N-acetyltransferase